MGPNFQSPSIYERGGFRAAHPYQNDPQVTPTGKDIQMLTFTRAVSSPTLLDIGIHFQILSFLLLKVQKTL